MSTPSSAPAVAALLTQLEATLARLGEALRLCQAEAAGQQAQALQAMLEQLAPVCEQAIRQGPLPAELVQRLRQARAQVIGHNELLRRAALPLDRALQQLLPDAQGPAPAPAYGQRSWSPAQAYRR